MRNQSRVGRSLSAVMLVAGMTTVALVGSSLPAMADTIVPHVTEIDHLGAPQRIEIQGDPNASLEGWQVWSLATNGQWLTENNAAKSSITVGAGVTFDSKGLYVVDVSATGNPDFVLGKNQSKTQGLALVAPCSNANPLTCPITEYLTWSSPAVKSTVAPTKGVTSTSMKISQSATAGNSLQLVSGAWIEATQTFGVENGGTGPGPNPDPDPGDITPIGAVVGEGVALAMPNATVTVQGIVTADYSTEGFNGFVVQDAGDSNDKTPDAIFVYNGTGPYKPAIGDKVKVVGKTTTYQARNQIQPTAVTIESNKNTLPEAKSVNLEGPDSVRLPYREMLVKPTGKFTVSEMYAVNTFGEITLTIGDKAARVPTELVPPGPKAAELAAVNATKRVILDDGSTRNMTSKDNVRPAPYISATNPVRTGDSVVKFGPLVLIQNKATATAKTEWRLQPTTPVFQDTPAADRTTFSDNSRPAKPVAVGGDVKVAAFNVLNYFTTTKDQNNASRGADTLKLFQIQKSKIVKAINALDADVVGLMEIEQSAGLGKARDQALLDLVDGLNKDAGSAVWAAVLTGSAPLPTGEDIIRTAFIYKTAKVTPVGDSLRLIDNAFKNARAPLAQNFKVKDQPVEFTAVVNHFKSKGSAPASGENADQGDGQGGWNPDRVRQSTAMMNWIAAQQTAGKMQPGVLIMGDINSYSMEDPTAVIKNAGYIDVGARTGKYSYVFGGEVGSLDHIFASSALASSITGADIWNINSVESSSFRYTDKAANLIDENSVYGASDHDPVIVGLDLSGNVNVQVVNINDFHGRLLEAGVPLAGTVEEAREANPNTVFASAGDNIGASTFVSASQKDTPTLNVLNVMGLATSAVGNHEFDTGFADLTGRIAAEADFPYLGANVYNKDTKTPALPEYEVVTVGGIRIAFVGVVTVETPTLVTPAGIDTLDFGDPVEAANRAAKTIKDGNLADVVVLLAHEGATESAKNTTLEEQIKLNNNFSKLITEASADVNAILTGHTHKEYVWDGPIPGSTKTRPIVQTGEYGKNLGAVTFKINTSTKEVISYTAKNIAATKTPAAELIAKFPVVKDVDDIIAEAKKESDVIGQVVVGTLGEDIARAGYIDPASGKFVEDRGTDSKLGQLTADAMKESTLKTSYPAEVAFMNPGGMRTDLRLSCATAPCDVTYADTVGVLPFANNLYTVELKGEDIIRLLEQQWQPASSSRLKLAAGVSGLTYAYNPHGTAGQRVSVDSVMVNGAPIDLGRVYKVATNNFLVSGGDNFTAFKNAISAKDTGKIDSDTLVEYFKAHPSVMADPNWRSSVDLRSSMHVDGEVPVSAQAGSSFTVKSIVTSGVDMAGPVGVTASWGGAPVEVTPNTLTNLVAGVGVEVAFTVKVGEVLGDTPITLELSSDQFFTGKMTYGQVVKVTKGDGGGVNPIGPERKITVDTKAPARGKPVAVSGSGFTPGANVELWLHSTPVKLASATVSADGTVKVSGVIPMNTTLGGHKVEVRETAGGFNAFANITVAESPDAKVAVTGVTIAYVLGGALILLAGGALALRLSRKRREASELA